MTPQRASVAVVLMALMGATVWVVSCYLLAGTTGIAVGSIVGMVLCIPFGRALGDWWLRVVR